MRWLVEVTPVGKTDLQKFVVEAESWQRALQAARAQRGEEGPMSGFSIELLEEGYRAVDPVAKVKFVVKRAPDDMPVTAPTSIRPPASMKAPASIRPPASIPVPSAVGKSKPPAKPSTSSMPATKSVPPRPMNGPASTASPPSAAPASLSSGGGVKKSPVGSPTPGLPAVKVLASREQDPTDASPLTYREYSFAVPGGTSEDVAVAVLRAQLKLVDAQLADAKMGKLVNLAVFDVEFTGKPPVAPLATLTWKDWKGEPAIGYPRRGTSQKPPRPPSVPPPASLPIPVPASMPPPAPVIPVAPPTGIPQPPTQPIDPPAQVSVRPASVRPPAPASVRPPPPQMSTQVVTPSSPPPPVAPSVPPPAVMATQVLTPSSPPPPVAPSVPPPAVAPSVPPPAVMATQVLTPSSPPPPVAPPVTPSAPPPPMAAVTTFNPGGEGLVRTPSGRFVRGRTTGDELITALFESMHDLHFLRDALDGGQFCLALATEVLPARAAVIHFFDIEKREWVVACTRGKDAARLLTLRTPESDELLRDAARKRRAVVIPAAHDASGERYTLLGGCKSLIVAPIMQAGRALGALEIINPLDGMPFNEDEGNAMTYIAEQFAEYLGSRGIVVDAKRIQSAANPSPR